MSRWAGGARPEVALAQGLHAARRAARRPDIVRSVLNTHDVAPPCLQALRAAPAPRRPAAAGPAAAPALRASRLDGVEMAPPDPILVRICNLPMITACVGKIVAPIAQHCGSKRQFSGCGWLVGGHC